MLKATATCIRSVDAVAGLSNVHQYSFWNVPVAKNLRVTASCSSAEMAFSAVVVLVSDNGATIVNN